MKLPFLTSLLSLSLGIIGFISIFSISSAEASSKEGFIAGFILYAIGSFIVTRRNIDGWWYDAGILNLPIIAYFMFMAETTQKHQYHYWLLGLLVCSYAGSILARFIYNKRN